MKNHESLHGFVKLGRDHRGQVSMSGTCWLALHLPPTRTTVMILPLSSHSNSIYMEVGCIPQGNHDCMLHPRFICADFVDFVRPDKLLLSARRIPARWSVDLRCNLGSLSICVRSSQHAVNDRKLVLKSDDTIIHNERNITVLAA